MFINEKDHKKERKKNKFYI